MPAMISFLRPVASIAARNFGSVQACVVVRSIGVISGKMAWISLKMGSTRTLPFAPIVLSTVGTPKAFAAAERPLTLLTSIVLSMESGCDLGHDPVGHHRS